jgi:nuclear transcription factor Y gamma
MIAAEAPVLFAKACEMFILELTLRSWIHTEENKRRTLQRNDIAGAITRGDIFDFLVDIVPRDELKDEDLAVPWAGVPGEPVPYGNMYYPPIQGQPMHHPMATPVSFLYTKKRGFFFHSLFSACLLLLSGIYGY